MLNNNNVRRPLPMVGGKVLRRLICSLIFAAMLLAASGAVWAANSCFVKGEDGSWYYRDANGKLYSAQYDENRQMGIVKISGASYCYRANGKKYTGFYTSNEQTRYFNPAKNGKMLRSARKTISGKVYRFDAKGIMYKNRWYGKYYYGPEGVLLKNAWVGDRYVGKQGKCLSGLQEIDGVYYYFDPVTGKKEKSKTITVGGKNYTFDKDGKCPTTKRKTSVSVESTFYTDPVVDDETLLSAIIYCESGNQPFYGQVAVGLVVMNRVRSGLCPNTIAEVVYQSQQFTPARNGTLTSILTGKQKVTDSCKEAAKDVLARYKTGNYKVKIKNTKGKTKTVDLSDYLFFMTPAAYARLGLKSTKLVIGDHVFFKTWG